jgi:hypothetical protein
MASFTDNIQSLTNFTPYRQQIPLDEMKQVGMYKQAKYEEGVQKIQTNIDNIAGLDMIRDIDKTYLQSKLNQLGNDLKFVAAGDFSNFQLVNSVNGMTNQISKDENVLTAVSSTSKLRKEQAFMEEQRKAGKSSPSNDWDFNTKANSWINSSEIGQSFSAKYTPYADVQKKYFEVLKGLHSDLTEQDIPYVIENGKVNYDKTAAAMQRISRETISKEKIENALRSSLTPVELEQLSIDGRYTFKDKTPEQLANQATEKYSTAVENNNKRIKELRGYANLKTSLPALRDKALGVIKDLEKNNEQLNLQLKEESDSAFSNPESAKVLLYKNSSIEQFATANAWEHRKENVMANPVKAQDNWEREFAQAQTKLNLDISKDAWDRKMDILNYNLEYDKLSAAEKKAKAKEKGEIGEFASFMGAGTDLGDPLKSAASSLENLKQSGEDIYSFLMEKTDASKDQIRNAVNAYQSGDKMKYAEAIKEIPVQFRNQVEKLVNIREGIRISTSALTTAETAANSSPEVIKMKNELNSKLQGLGNYTITTASGKVTFTPQEVAAFIGKKNIKSYGVTPGFMADPVSTKSVTYSSPLTAKEKILSTHNFSMAETDGYNRFLGLTQTASSNLERKRNEIKYREFNKLNQKWMPKLADINVGKGEDDNSRQFYENVTTNLLMGNLEEFAGIKGGNKYSTKEQREELMEIFSAGTKDKKDNLQYKLFEQGDDKVLIVVNGNTQYRLPMTAQAYNQLPIDTDTRYRDVRNAQKAQGGTTNNTGLFQNSWYKKTSFPKTTLNIKADLVTGDGENQFVTLRINTPRGVAVIPLESEFDSAENAELFFKNITDKDLTTAVLNSSDDVVSPEIKALFK